MDKISIKINNKICLTDPKKTILEAARENGIEIPYLCSHSDVKTKHHCGVCIVLINGEKKMKRACTTLVEKGMEITTESRKINKERIKRMKIILEKHLLECDDCVWLGNCQILDLINRLGIKPISKKDNNSKVFQVEKMVFDQTKCIGCGNCLDVCPTNYLNLNQDNKIECSQNKEVDCINCGQCVLHCPVGAIEGVGEFEELENIFKDKNKTTVVQFAPSIRASLGNITTKQLVSGLKRLGFNYVFDTASGADFTTMEESDELIERLTSNKKLPVMSSCCPAWVKFIEFNYPEFIPNLCTSRSPQTMLGGIVKTYFSHKHNINPKNIFVVSIMPCIAKKFEIKREELKINDIYPVDLVLTTRELIRLFKKNRIDLEKIEEIEADNPLGNPSGAGVIYGTSGGVFESALRTAYFKMTKKNLGKDAVKEIRGEKGIKTKEIKIGEKAIKVAVVSGIKNAKKILEELKNKPDLYDAVEVMACPGGCVGGGGQPLPTNRKIVKNRSKLLYFIDDKNTVKCAHENLAIKKIYKEFFNNIEIRKKILHTKFIRKNKANIKRLINSRETKE